MKTKPAKDCKCECEDDTDPYFETYLADFVEANGLDPDAHDENAQYYLDGKREDYYMSAVAIVERLAQFDGTVISYGEVGLWNGTKPAVPKLLHKGSTLGDLIPPDKAELAEYGFSDGAFYIKAFHHDGHVLRKFLPLRKNRLGAWFDEDYFYATGAKYREAIEKVLRKSHARRFTQQEADALLQDLV